MARPDLAMAVDDVDDAQALLRTGLPSLTEARFLLLRIADPKAARAWLALAPVTGIAHLRRDRAREVLQLGLTPRGLLGLGLSSTALGGFSDKFLSGLSGDEGRSRRLGDTGPSSPTEWRWGAGERKPDLVLLFYAEPGRLELFARRIADDTFARGFTELTRLETSDMQGHEPFGFLDGISQSVPAWPKNGVVPAGDGVAYRNRIALGEFLLGHVNEYGLITERPLLPDAEDGGRLLPAAPDVPGMRDFGRNGTYLVIRQLEQDVHGFWSWVAAQAPEEGRIALAEAMVGRRIDGRPLLPQSDLPIQGVGPNADDVGRNQFTYDCDPDGVLCPFGAHVRRANPRTGDMPAGTEGLLVRTLTLTGLNAAPSEWRRDCIASTRYHRLIRRAREYGRKLSPVEAMRPDAPDPISGLHFLCLAANIARQFEFVQNSWLMNAKFNGMMDETDPLIGGRGVLTDGRKADRFSRATKGGPAEHYSGLPRFVRVRGGAYFFMPSLSAIRFLAIGQSNVSAPSGS